MDIKSTDTLLMNAKQLLKIYGVHSIDRLSDYIGILYAIGFVLVGVDLILPIFTKVLFDDVFRDRQSLALGTVISALACFYVMQFVLRSSYDFLSIYIYQRIALNIRSKIYIHLQNVMIRKLNVHSKGDLITRLTDDTERSMDFLLTQRLDLTFSILQVVSISLVCFWINSDATLILISSIPFYLISSHYIFKNELGVVRDQLIFKKSEIIEFLQLKFRQIAMIKSFNSQSYESSHFEHLVREQYSLGVHDRILKWIFSMNSHLGFDLWTVFATWYFGRDLIRGRMSLGDLVALLLLFGLIRQVLLGLTQMFGRYRAGVSSLLRIHDVLSWPIEDETPSVESATVVDGKIEIRNLNFGYSSTKQIFTDLSLTIEPHTYVTLVGDYGAGKSTLIQLILGNEVCEDGKILIDGVSLNRYKRDEIRRKIISVSRDQGIFPGTVRENITYGQTSITDWELTAELKDLQIWEWVTEFPNGLDTVLASETDLSRSERQRLAILRSLLKNPRVVILDEVISDLDPMSDYLMQNAIKRMLAKRTVIAVTKNISTLRGADRIIYIRNGVVEDDGDFDQLIKKRGEFFVYYLTCYGKFSEFRKILDYEIERSFRHKSIFSIATVNIFNFDSITAPLSNVEISRLSSDIFLEWTQVSRSSDLVTEFRSGVYLVLLPEIDETKAQLYLERVQKLMAEKTFRIKGEKVKLRFLAHVETYNSDKNLPRSSQDVVNQAVYVKDALLETRQAS